MSKNTVAERDLCVVLAIVAHTASESPAITDSLRLRNSYDFLVSAPAPATSCFFFFAFNFSFALLRSLFFSPDIPCLQTSAYLTKKPSRSSDSTTVDNLTFLARLSFDLPLEARMRMGNGLEGWRSENGWFAERSNTSVSMSSLCVTITCQVSANTSRLREPTALLSQVNRAMVLRSSVREEVV
jgi:hypothetical protein